MRFSGVRQINISINISINGPGRLMRGDAAAMGLMASHVADSAGVARWYFFFNRGLFSQNNDIIHFGDCDSAEIVPRQFPFSLPAARMHRRRR